MEAKADLLRVIHHDNPRRVPDGMEAVVTVGAPVVERSERAGKDAYDVAWLLKADAQGSISRHPVEPYHRLDVLAGTDYRAEPERDRLGSGAGASR
ncbi:MAG: hypothetical protein MUQ10_20195 [Anaerolineae bacterium]|nr:hypothetical protein [Anaerolineae bacterium]